MDTAHSSQTQYQQLPPCPQCGNCLGERLGIGKTREGGQFRYTWITKWKCGRKRYENPEPHQKDADCQPTTERKI